MNLLNNVTRGMIMEYRRLKSDEVIQEGDQYRIDNTWVMSDAIGCDVECEMDYRRPLAATFDESSNFEPPIHVSQETVSDETKCAYCGEIFPYTSAHNCPLDVTDMDKARAKMKMEIGKLDNFAKVLSPNTKVSDPQYYGQGGMGEAYSNLRKMEAGDKEKAIAACLALFKGMDRIIPPTVNQLGVLYDNGLLNITK